MDAANAAMMGASNGLMPSMKGAYRGAEGVSNIMPGVGLEGGMEAQAALNKASNVNKLRMIGISVRDANGMPRAVEDVARQIWNQLKNMTGGDGKGAITAQDLDFALQSGNSLDSMLNQYFGNDPILRQSVIRYLYQFASGKGTSKKDLQATGANPAVSQSMGNRNAGAYSAINAYTNRGVQGVTDANNAIASLARVAAAMEFLFGPLVQLTTFMQTLSGGANGGIGNILGGLGNMIGPAIMMFGSKAWSSLTGLFKGGAKDMFAKASEWAKGAWGKVADASKSFWSKAGGWAKGAWDKVAGWGKGVWDWVKGLFGGGKAATPATTAARTGAAAAGSRAIPIIGTLLTILSLSGDTAKPDPNAPVKPKPKPMPFSPSFGVDPNAGKDPGPLDDLFGGGEGGDGKLYGMGDSGIANPADNYKSKITSTWGQIRHLVIDGKNVTTKPHGGMDIGIPEGTSVKAVKDGEVVHTGYNPDGFGHNVIIQHEDGYQTVYAHLSSKSMQKGDKVTAGQLVGLSGNTGFSSGPHLHFQVQKQINGKTFDPAAYLTGSKDLTASGTASGVHSGTAEESVVSNALFSSSSGSLFSGVKPKGGAGGSESSDPTILPTTGGGRGGNNVTVHINVPASAAINEQTLAREVKRILQEDERVRMAVNR